KHFRVSILTEEETIYDGEVRSLVVPAELGFMGVLADHAPLAARLKPGRIVLKTFPLDEPKVFNSSGKGFLEILNNKVTLLLDAVVSSHKL
ncbi:MAG: F0F1 ATP synthase subunit epsilon, partial [Candidatus Omnitrophota bacterium]